MRFKTLLVAAAVALSVAACSQSGIGTKQTIGGLGGAALGGLLGSQFGSGTGQLAFTAAGAVLGGLAGSEIGRSMDEVDRLRAAQAQQRASAAPIGQTIVWNNPNTGNSGAVTAVRDGTSNTGQYCREFQQTVNVGGRTETAFGTACRQQDGTWRVVS
ncbi:MAG: glycine zipper 2TM domain-containing protein [Kiloniellales bacterium]|nr:glycine zipper 2TM domain-containing protein [Kiloniellales bacterium]